MVNDIQPLSRLNVTCIAEDVWESAGGAPLVAVAESAFFFFTGEQDRYLDAARAGSGPSGNLEP